MGDATTAAAESDERAAKPSLSMGCALFDDKDTATSGWCCRGDGDSTPRRFSTPSELDPSVIWITNVAWAKYTDSIKSCSHIRLPTFYRVNLDMMMREIGFDPSALNVRDVVVALADILDRAWKLSTAAWEGLLADETMHESIYKQARRRDPPDFDRIEQVMKTAYQDNSIVLGVKWEPGIISVKFVPNRVRHVIDVTSIGIPSGAWAIKNEKTSVDDFLKIETPSFADCEISMDGAALADLLAYGVQYGGNGKSTLRQWISQPEMLFLVEHAKIKQINSILSFDQFESPPQLPDILLNDSMTALSYSAGVVAESFLVAYSGRRTSARHNFRPYHPPRAVWMKAVDRAISFGQARRLHECGIRVTGYGFGAVSAKVFAHEINDAADIGADCGFFLMDGRYPHKNDE